MTAAIHIIATVLLISGSWITASGQIVYTRSFTDKLEVYGLEYVKPAESWDRIVPLKKDDFFEYDMVIYSEKSEIEIRYVFESKETHPLSQFPHLSFSRFVVNAATNNEEKDLIFRTLSDAQVVQLNAEWAATADFIPKEELTGFSRGKVLSFSRESMGVVHVMILFNEESNPVLERMHVLRFKIQTDGSED